MTFLPENYEVPSATSYYFNPSKIEAGDYDLRILSSPVMGYERWEDKTPIRIKMGGDKGAFGEHNYKTNPDGWKHFWAMVIYNYQDEAIQVWEVTQNTIMGLLKDLADHPKWGDPKQYDITFKKVKTGPEARDVEYGVMGTPPIGDPSKEVLQALVVANVNLEALYSGDDPFANKLNEDVDVSPEEVAGAEGTVVPF